MSLLVHYNIIADVNDVHLHDCFDMNSYPQQQVISIHHHTSTSASSCSQSQSTVASDRQGEETIYTNDGEKTLYVICARTSVIMSIQNVKVYMHMHVVNLHHDNYVVLLFHHCMKTHDFCIYTQWCMMLYIYDPTSCYFGCSKTTATA